MRTFVEIVWDRPEEQAWLCPDNIKTALAAYCPNTSFEVKDVGLKLKQLDEITAIQSSPGNRDANEYMRGLANGLITANRIVNDSAQELFSDERPVFLRKIID